MNDTSDLVTSRDQTSSTLTRQFWILAGLAIFLLFGAYWFFIRQDYVPVLSGVEPQDAADIVKVLEAKKVPYQLADHGQTIKVASGEADKARIELFGSELPMHGQVGFELFNQSDMGLTEFAQKINYQRALQGELARTILMLEGIQSVRVHLGLPEQSLFRDEQVHPKASITLILKPGAVLTQGRVDGIQRMVAGAIPDLTPDGVTVLDGSGRIVSSSAPVISPPQSSSDAIVTGFRQRVSAAIASRRPDLVADVNVSVQYLGPVTPTATDVTNVAGKSSNNSSATETPPEPAPRGDPDFALTIRVTTKDALDDKTRGELTAAIDRAVELNTAKGDSLTFLTGWAPQPFVGPIASAPERVVSKRETPPAPDSAYAWLRYWPVLSLLAVLALLAAFVSDRSRARKRRQKDLSSFALQLQERLHAAEVDGL